MSAKSAVTVLRSPSIAVAASGCPGLTRISEAIDAAGERVSAAAALRASAVPQSSQNADEGAFSAPHFAQRLDSELPQAAQNFLPVVLSVPHLLQRIALPGTQATDPSCITRRREGAAGCVTPPRRWPPSAWPQSEALSEGASSPPLPTISQLAPGLAASRRFTACVRRQ